MPTGWFEIVWIGYFDFIFVFPIFLLYTDKYGIVYGMSKYLGIDDLLYLSTATTANIFVPRITEKV